MNKVFVVFVSLFVLNLGHIMAAPLPLMPANFVEVDNGNISENILIADDGGKIFIEFSKDTKFVNAEGKINFSGEILPPQVIELDIKKPKGLIRELDTFELVSSTGADVAFIDKYDKISRKNLFREQLLNPEGLNRSFWVKFIYAINDPLVSLPKLWEWQGEELGWKRVGGFLSDTADGEEDLRILSATLRRTGIYSVFDENPAPQNFADQYEIHSTEKRENYDEASEYEEPFDITEYSFEGEAINDLHGSSPIEINNEIEIPSIPESESSELLQEFEQLVSKNSAKIANNSEMRNKVESFSVLLEKKAKIESEKEEMTAELNNISFSLANAESPEEKDNLEKTFLDLQTSLYKVEDLSSEEEIKFVTLKKEIDDFFAGITLSNKSENIVEDNLEERTSEEDFYIPENAELTKSGGKDTQKISWAFPIFLIICFGLFGSAIFSAKKKTR